MSECPFPKVYPSTLTKNAEYYMSFAFNQAVDAWNSDEVPIGAVIVHEEEIISSAFNQTRKQTDPTAHAEMIAISMAARRIGDWRLNECEMYVTKEPCPMCAGASIISRLTKIYFAMEDPKMGGLGGASSLHLLPRSNHKPLIESGVLKKPCEEIIQAFFKMQRQQVSS